MKKEFLIDRQGKSFVLYAGLLDAAHEKGLKAIRTQMLQAPSKDNGEMSIFRAVVEFDDGRVFEGTGDATPQNVGRNIVPHALRMAETRAKARALRDALNIGAVSLEELGDPSEEELAAPRAMMPRQQTPGAGAAPASAGAPRSVPPPTAAVRTPPPPAHPKRKPELAALWVKADEAHRLLGVAGVKPPMLPPDEADEAELLSYVDDCRAIYRKQREQKGAEGK